MKTDIFLFTFLNNMAVSEPWTASFVAFCGRFFPDIVVIGFLIYAFYFIKKRRDKLFLFFAGATGVTLGAITVQLIRIFIERPRPFVSLPAITLIEETSFSFPSSHATFFFALATTVFLHNKKWGVLFYIAALIIGLARVGAGVHYPTDILFGAILGSFISLLIYRGFSYFNKRML